MSLLRVKRYENFEYEKFKNGDYSEYELVTNSGCNVSVNPIDDKEFIGVITPRYLTPTPITNKSEFEIRYDVKTSLPIGVEFKKIEEYRILVDTWKTRYVVVGDHAGITTYTSEKEAETYILPSDKYLLEVKLPVNIFI